MKNNNISFMSGHNPARNHFNFHSFSPFIFIYFYFFSILFLASCDKQPEIFTIGVSHCSSNSWSAQTNEELSLNVKAFPNTALKIAVSNSIPQQQMAQIDSLIQSGIDLLAVEPLDADCLTEKISEIYRSGIPVILFNRMINSDDFTAYVGSNNYVLAKNIAEYTAKTLNGKGNIVLIRGTEGGIRERERYDGFISAIQNYPDIHIIATPFCNYSIELSKRKMSELIAQYGDDIDLIFAFIDPMAQGASEAYKMFTNLKRPFIIGVNGLLGDGLGVDNVQNGIIDATFRYPTGGRNIIEIAEKIRYDKPFDRITILNNDVIDKDNISIVDLERSIIKQLETQILELSDLLSDTQQDYSRQARFSIILLICIILAAGFAVLLVLSIRKQISTNDLLKKQKGETENQVIFLEKQHKQLLQISKQLEEATQAKLMFFTDISHEFKTPLSLILGPISELLDSGRLTPDDYDTLKLCLRNGQKLRNLLEQILEFRKYESGELKMNAQMGDLQEFIQELNNMFTKALSYKKVNFEFNVAPNDYRMAFDKEKMDTIYFNLMSNAIKYVNKGGTIKVDLNISEEEGGHFVSLSVFNSGSYISEDKTKDIFKRFFHIDNEHENTGIGLALCKSLVELHDGTISVSSTEDLSTTFTVSFPVSIISEDDYEKSDESYSHSAIRKHLDLQTQLEASQDRNILKLINTDKPTILVIEDNDDMQQYIQLCLSSKYFIVQAKNGKEGVEKAIKHIPALIIADIMMPVMDGFDVCRLIRNNQMTTHIPIICLSAFNSDEHMKMCYEVGADAFMTKPFNSNVLRTRIEKLIERSTTSSNNNIFNNTHESILITEGGKNQLLIKRISQYVEENIHSNISVESIASHLGISKSRLYRQLKEITDYTLIDIISLIRLNKGATAMLRERKTISEAAFDAGFTSPSYFTKTFIKYYKERPSDYVKRYTSILPQDDEKPMGGGKTGI